MYLLFIIYVVLFFSETLQTLIGMLKDIFESRQLMSHMNSAELH